MLGGSFVLKQKEIVMRKIIVATFLTMDGVMQAPGGPQEDTRNGFSWGGWMFPFSDHIVNEAIGALFTTPFELLLGRRTYEIFSAHWPYQNDQIGEIFNRIRKYVVATTPVDTSWHNSTLISSDVVNELKRLKGEDGPDLLVHGSATLVQTLLANNLVDELHTLTFPITLGKGIKLFQQGTQPTRWRLIASAVSSTGALIGSYIPDGDVPTGSFVPDNPSESEIARRKRWLGEEE